MFFQGTVFQSSFMDHSFSMLEVIVRVVFYVLVIVGEWRIFEKAGESGWKSLIPIYNAYILYKIAWDSRIFWVELILSLIASIVPLIGLICIIGVCLINIGVVGKLSFAFGHGIGFAVGLFFLRPLFIIILGFGSSRYYGPER